MVSAYCCVVSSGNAGRWRNVGTPKVKPFVIETCGGRPRGLLNDGAFTRFANSYGDGGCANSNSKSRPYWKRSSLAKFVVIIVSSLATPQVSFTKSLPKLLVAKVFVACVWIPAGEFQRMRLKEKDAWFLALIAESSLG